jgi:hypothetical protein
MNLHTIDAKHSCHGVVFLQIAYEPGLRITFQVTLQSDHRNPVVVKFSDQQEAEVFYAKAEV